MDKFELCIDNISIKSTELVQNWINENEDRELVKLELFPPTYIIKALKEDVDLFLQKHPCHISYDSLRISFIIKKLSSVQTAICTFPDNAVGVSDTLVCLTALTDINHQLKEAHVHTI